jgi:hypothetical protein
VPLIASHWSDVRSGSSLCENSLVAVFGGYLVNLLDRNLLILLMLNFQEGHKDLIWT